MALPAELCNRCRTVFSDLVGAEEMVGFDHQPSLEALKDAGQSGCPICHWISLKVNHAVDTDPDVNTKVTSANSEGKLLTTKCLSQNKAGWYLYGDAIPLTPGQRHRMQAEFCLFVDGVRLHATECVILFRFDYGIETYPRGYKPQSYTGAHNTLQLAHRWLQECLASHDLCTQRHTAQLPPSRLLKILENGSVALRQAFARDYNSGVQYLTLSHRWTPDMQTVLRKSNLRALQRGISLTDLKRSIQDAVQVATYLGVKYLWVDSLCIIQDDEANRAREIGLMAQVYGNAVCNLVASDAEANDKGLFFPRNEHDVRSFVVKNVNGPTDLVAQSHHISRDWDHIKQRLQSSALEQRAWVFQETLLAPRVLYFCKNEVHWECVESEACETFPGGSVYIPGAHYLRSAARQPRHHG